MLPIFEASARIATTMQQLPKEHIKKAVLMALVAVDHEGLLVDPSTITMCPSGPAEASTDVGCGSDDEPSGQE